MRDINDARQEPLLNVKFVNCAYLTDVSKYVSQLMVNHENRKY